MLEPEQIVADRYIITEYLDEGGMQKVYKAIDRRFDKTVVVKVPKNASADKRFRRGALLSAKVTHENVAKTLDFVPHHETEFIVEEFIPGMDLKKFSELHSRLDPDTAASIAHQFSRGLAAAHHADIFHRDLKPSNIMINLDERYHVKITDFGIAKFAGEELDEAIEEGEESISSSKTAVGALPYMAPELLNGEKLTDKSADVWAFGAILYHLMTGAPPYGTGVRSIYNLAQAKDLEPPSYFNRQKFAYLNTQLWDIIQNCMNRDPKSRWDADQVLTACDQLCYADSPWSCGVIEEYPLKRAHQGLARTEEGATVFFHDNVYFGKRPMIGLDVRLTVFPGHPYPRAGTVLPADRSDEAAPAGRRSRLRQPTQKGTTRPSFSRA